MISARANPGSPGFWHNRLTICFELLLAAGCIGLKLGGIIHNPTLLILVIAVVSLSMRHAWSGIGLGRPRRWMAILALGVGIGVVYDVADVFMITPALQRIAGTPVHVEAIETSVKGNPGMLLFYVVLVWTLGAFCEELVYRGYLFKRMVELLGGGKSAVAVSGILVTLVFGLIHINQGRAGVLDNLLAGALFLTLYLCSKRNLWLAIIVHGVTDTTSLVLLWFGIRPG